MTKGLQIIVYRLPKSQGDVRPFYKEWQAQG